MGRLAGFRYQQVIKKLKMFGFEFDRQAAGSHEIWFNSTTNRYTTIPTVIKVIDALIAKRQVEAALKPIA